MTLHPLCHTTASELTSLNRPGPRTQKAFEAARRTLIMDVGQAQRNIRTLGKYPVSKKAANHTILFGRPLVPLRVPTSSANPYLSPYSYVTD